MTGVASKLPGVPHIENPFFDEIFSNASLDPSTMRIANDLRSKGYATIDFPDDEIEEIADRIKATLTPKMTDGEPRIQDAWAFDSDVKRIAVNQAILDLLQVLYGRKAFPFQTLNFLRGSQQRIHSDSVHFSSNPERFMCGVWVALEDVTLDSGPLMYYPGSHSWPILSNEQLGVNVYSLDGPLDAYPKFIDTWEALVHAKNLQPETFLAKKGQALIWTANLLHGGFKQTNPDRTRWSQVTHYYFEDCGYYTPLFSNPFSGKIYFRAPQDITSGEIKTNRDGGLVLPDRLFKMIQAGWDASFEAGDADPIVLKPSSSTILGRLSRAFGLRGQSEASAR